MTATLHVSTDAPIATSSTPNGAAIICSPALKLVLQERLEQVERHGRLPETDLLYQEGELARGAHAFLVSAIAQQQDDPDLNDQAEQLWPFALHTFRPGEELTALVKAAAMILADIDRVIVSQGLIAAGGTD